VCARVCARAYTHEDVLGELAPGDGEVAVDVDLHEERVELAGVDPDEDVRESLHELVPLQPILPRGGRKPRGQAGAGVTGVRGAAGGWYGLAPAGHARRAGARARRIGVP
jgi:hypothetical protein